MTAQIHHNANIDDYYAGKLSAGPALSQSCAKTILEQSPKHAWMNHPRLNPEWKPSESTKAQIIGQAAHKLLIGKGAEVQVIEAEDFRTKAARELRDEATAKGMIPILVADWAEVAVMVDAAGLQLDALGLRGPKGYSGEVAVTWRDEDCDCQTLIDLLHESNRIVLDIKTTGGSASPTVIATKAANDGWDIQAAFHKSALDAVDPDGIGRRRHVFALLENYPPYAMTVMEMTESWLCMGTKRMWRACEIWRECIRTGNWPAYPAEVQTPGYPEWAENSWIKRELAEAV